MTNTRDKLAKGIMVGAEEKMSTELKTGADLEQSRRLVVHWHDMWSIQKRENELLKRRLEVALKAIKKAHQEMKMTAWREEKVFDVLTKSIETIEENK